MSYRKTISQMFTGFADIINSLKAHGRDILNVELENEILRSLLKSWEPKVTLILEVKDLSTLELEQLI